MWKAFSRASLRLGASTKQNLRPWTRHIFTSRAGRPYDISLTETQAKGNSLDPESEAG
jgi:hypothetical protein